MTREQKQEFTLRISQANSTEMIVILYEMLLCYVEDGKEAIEHQEKESLKGAVRKAKACLGELIHSLHLQYEPAPALLGLCGFCIRQLTIAEIREKQEPLEQIEKIIQPLRDAFGEIAAENKGGPVMNNSQTVYAGLTYSKSSLTENMAEQSANRGMYA